MKMNKVKSVTWSKVAQIPTDDFSIEGIARAINTEFGETTFADIAGAIADGSIPVAINTEFGEPFFEDILEATADGYIQICEDGIIIWCSGKEANEND